MHPTWPYPDWGHPFQTLRRCTGQRLAASGLHLNLGEIAAAGAVEPEMRLPPVKK